MLTNVMILQASTPVTLAINNADPTQPLILTSISGLDPADVTLFMGDFAKENSYYQGRPSQSTQPGLQLQAQPELRPGHPGVSDIREGLYRTFMEPQALSRTVSK